MKTSAGAHISTNPAVFIGLDIGSTTTKMVVTDQNSCLLFSYYDRFKEGIKQTLKEAFSNCFECLGNVSARILICGSGAISIAQDSGIVFEQEVRALHKALCATMPSVKVAFEIGGEDAKVLFLDDYPEMRMNGQCAGGTGAFIEQMACLLEVSSVELGDLASKHRHIYPIGARCAVFARTDIKALINQGAAREDIAASVLQAVVNQTISGLAQSHPIVGDIVLLGGPAYFLPALAKQFSKSLGDSVNIIKPSFDARLAGALGCSILAAENEGDSYSLSEIYCLLESAVGRASADKSSLSPLFVSQNEVLEFSNSQRQNKTKTGVVSGSVFLGIDSGSTATKVALINGDGHLLFSDRLSNRKDPIRACQILIDRVNLFLSVYPDAALTHCFVTGYGADSICLAIGANEAISETIAHALAAQTLFPEAQAVLDIGGQDIKLITFDRDRFGEVRFCDSCSSGCGIFMETLLHELDEDDAFLYSQALTAQKPVDFGSRCTVFMNTSIKQARQRGSSDADILAGLCYSIVQNAVNALMGDLGVEDSSFFLVAQGGLLENDAILRALEITLGHAVMRPAHASCMGAFGAALFALKTWSREKKKGIFESVCLLDSPHTTITRKCNLCSNACLLNETSFDNGRSFVSGNRCEKGAGSAKSNSLPNLFAYRNKRVFGYDSLSSEDAPRGSMGLIRALEMYDHYPFWHTLFTTLGYRVVISAESSKSILVKGMDTIPSESVCYPAKLSHGHVVDLIEKGVDSIFIPSVDEAILVSGGTAHPCPVITDYPHVLAANISNKRTKILHVTVSFVNDGAMAEALSEAFPSIPQKEIFLAIKAGFEELRHFHKDMSKQGEKALKYLEYSGSSGLVLLGKAYHTDPQIAHGIDTLAMQEGFAVLSADSIAHLTPAMDETHVDWSTSEQLLAAAFVVARYSCLEAVHLTSFGCLSDAVVSERLKEVLHASNKTYSQIKLDGGMNISSARIRLRSIKDQARLGVPGDKGEAQERLHSAQVDAVANGRFLFLPMIPTAWLEPIEHIFSGRFRCVRPTRASVEQCLRTGRHLLGKDACNPVAIMVGQTVETLRGDPRAGICILAPPQAARCCDGGFGYLMRRAFKFAGIEDLDVVEADSIASLAVDVLDALAAYLCFEDLLRHMSCLRRDSQGKHREVTNRWRSKVCKELARNKRFDLETVVSELIDDPAWSAHSDKKATFIGITGEILTSLSELQGELIEQILQKGGTPVPSPVSLWLYWHLADLSVRQLPASIDSIRTSLMGALKRTMGIINEALLPRSDILPVAFPCANSEQENRSEMSSLGNRYVIEDIESLLRRGVYNILCLQPVSCLPNHARGRGCLKNLLEHYPKLNMLSLDYSSKTNTINLLNRIIMFMGVAEDRATEKG